VSDPHSVFVCDGDYFVPTALAQGPWAQGVLHGGPTGALLAHLCERFDGGQPDEPRVARIAIDLLRPVPSAPLRARVRLARPGRKVDWVDASLFAGDVEVARGSALRVRVRPLEMSPGIDPWSRGAAGDQPFDGSQDDGDRFVRGGQDSVSGFHDRGIDLRFVRSNPGASGPGQVWGRLNQPLVAGVPTTPLMRVVACADFGNAASSLMPAETHSYINPDLVVALWREPQGEWIGLDAVTRVDPAAGAGLAEMALHDHAGPIGRAQQTVLVERRA
jgi:Thioesterase-like superfamily